MSTMCLLLKWAMVAIVGISPVPLTLESGWSTFYLGVNGRTSINTTMLVKSSTW